MKCFMNIRQQTELYRHNLGTFSLSCRCLIMATYGRNVQQPKVIYIHTHTYIYIYIYSYVSSLPSAEKGYVISLRVSSLRSRNLAHSSPAYTFKAPKARQHSRTGLSVIQPSSNLSELTPSPCRQLCSVGFYTQSLEFSADVLPGKRY
jgi:hypothetical protein